MSGSPPDSSSSGAKSNDPPQPPPSYAEHDAHEAQAYMAVTTTTQTTTFFTLPLWRRKAGLPIALTASERPDSHGRVVEDGRSMRSSSVNVDFNKELPRVPSADANLEPSVTRRSMGSLQEPQQHAELTIRPGRASTLMPPIQAGGSTTKTLAQAGLGMGLPYVMPAAAKSLPSAKSTSSSTPRPSTAPRPDRLHSSPVIRRVRSSARLESGPSGMNSQDELNGGTRRSTLFWPASTGASNNGNAHEGSEEARPKTVIKKASFWNRRRVQSMRDVQRPDNASSLAQRATSPVPALPHLVPNSPMFPDRSTQKSPSSSPLVEPVSPAPSPKLRRRHSERSSTSPRLPRTDVNTIEETPPIPRSSNNRPRTSKGDESTRSPTTMRRSANFSHPDYRPGPMSFISSPAVSSFPVVNGVQRPVSRPRSMTNPPNLLHRLSMGIFNSPTSSPLSSPTISTNNENVSSSPRHSATLGRSSLSKPVLEIPTPNADDGETPDGFLIRLEEAVSKAELANLLARNNDPFYTQALNVYIRRFDFTNNPLDIALRRFLMDVGLPKETQQIDRVIEAFASCYSKCNPDLFVSEDHPYILAFSLIMLHTDAFNKSNKRKMTKADYIKNTKLVGIPSEVLDYFFDNIVFAPFIFIEDPLDVNGQRGLTPEGQGSLSSGLLGKSNKIDPYYLIARNLLSDLRVDVESHIPYRNPFSYQGTAGSWNEAELRKSFARADVVEVDSSDSRKSSSMPLFAMNTGGPTGPLPTSTERSAEDYLLLKVTKVGILNRKEDLVNGGKRAMSRKWKEWSVVLTGSQLVFYRDSSIALNLITKIHDASEGALARYPSQRPDEVVSMKNAVAVCDASYDKHHHVLRFVLSSGRQLLLQAENEKERNEWVAHINYASSFKTAGIRMRPLSTLPARDKRPDTGITRKSGEIEEHGSLIESHTASAPSSPDRRSLSIASTNSRARIVESKVRELEARLQSLIAQIDSERRVVRNLAILTPFQKSTRDRLQATVTGMSKHIRQLRLEIVKLTCYRDVLLADLNSEARDEKQAGHDDGDTSRTKSGGASSTLAVDIGNSSSKSLAPSGISDGLYVQRNSSICESFHSALDFSTDMHSNGAPRNSSSSRRMDSVPERSSNLNLPSSQVMCYSQSNHSTDGLSDGAPISAATSNKSDCADNSDNDQNEPRELAEEWDKTRAARRVSLVKVPEGIVVSSRSIREKHASSIAPVENDRSPSFDEALEEGST